MVIDIDGNVNSWPSDPDHAAGLGTSFASGEGIEDRLFVQPTTLFQVDEIDGLLLRVSQARDARHEQIISMLLQMYSAASTVYVMRAKAGREWTVIDQPCLCLFGTAVPKHFYEALSARLLTNGFLARFLTLECRGRGIGQNAHSITDCCSFAGIDLSFRNIRPNVMKKTAATLKRNPTTAHFPPQ